MGSGSAGEKKCAGLRILLKSFLWHGKQKEEGSHWQQLSPPIHENIYIVETFLKNYQIYTYSKKDCTAIFKNNNNNYYKYWRGCETARSLICYY